MEMTNAVFNWVVSNGYADLNEWAADSNYRRVGRDSWRDEHGNDVDIWECAFGAMTAARQDTQTTFFVAASTATSNPLIQQEDL